MTNYIDYKKIRLLGEGAYGKAFLVESLNDGLKWVIKEIDMDFMEESEQ